MKEEGLKVMQERFGKDNVIVLGTIDGEYPAVRQVNGYYEDGAFYIITYALSNKMKQIGVNPNVSVCAEWFSGKGKAVNMGYFGKEENREHNNFDDENTIILKIDLLDCVLFSHGTRYEINFR